MNQNSRYKIEQIILLGYILADLKLNNISYEKLSLNEY